MKQSLKVGVSGVRGVVGPSLSPGIVVAFAQAFGTYMGRGPVVVGRDTRSTGHMLEQAVIAGLQSVGCKPLLVGIVATPTVQIMTRHLGARGGICITASHNDRASLKLAAPRVSSRAVACRYASRSWK